MLINNPADARWRRLLTLAMVFVIVAVTTPLALARDTTYEIELVVTDGKESKETDADITFKEGSFTIVPDKPKFASSAKEFNFADLKTADYSYSKKPMLSGGGAIATALLVGFIFALPFLFIKKKNHWMTVQTEKEFAVMKLGGHNFRQVVAEFETHGVKVNTVAEEKK